MTEEYNGFAKKAVHRFYITIINNVAELLSKQMITEETTVKELLIICRQKEKEFG